MPAEILVTREILAEDTVFILQCLRENAREGRSMHMMDVRNYLANSVTLEFSDYLRFLRKFGYVTLDREQHTLGLTAAGDQTAQQEPAAALVGQLEEFFSDKLKEGVIEVQTEEDERSQLGSLVTPSRPPPPHDPTPLPGPAPSIFASLRAGGFSSPPPTPPPSATGAFSNVSPVSYAPAGGEDELIYLRGEQIGQGTLGAVFRARHASLGTEIAVKEIRETAVRRAANSTAFVTRLKTELGAQARLRHPAVVQIFDLDVTVPQPFAVLELCGGGNLRDRLKIRAGAGLEPALALRAFAQVLSGLAAAHAQGLTHLNLKAENVLFDVNGNAKLGDFGLSRLLSTDGDDPRTVVDTGNMSYLAPEVLRPTGVAATAAADVYALGILLYEALTGRVPGRRSPLPSKAAPGVPAEIDEMFDRMTADAIDERYPDAGAVEDELFAAFPDGRYGQPGVFLLATALPEADEQTDPGSHEKRSDKAPQPASAAPKKRRA